MHKLNKYEFVKIVLILLQSKFAKLIKYKNIFLEIEL